MSYTGDKLRSSFIRKVFFMLFTAGTKSLFYSKQTPFALCSAAFVRNSIRSIASTKQLKRQLNMAHVNGEEALPSKEFTFTDDEKYLFDTFGYLIVRNVLTQEEVDCANDAVDKHMQSIQERVSPVLRNTKKNTAFSGDGKRGRMDLGGVLEWGEDSKVFKSILAHPKLVPKFHGLIGKGYRMDHNPFLIAQDKVTMDLSCSHRMQQKSYVKVKLILINDFYTVGIRRVFTAWRYNRLLNWCI